MLRVEQGLPPLAPAAAKLTRDEIRQDNVALACLRVFCTGEKVLECSAIVIVGKDKLNEEIAALETFA